MSDTWIRPPTVVRKKPTRKPSDAESAASSGAGASGAGGRGRAPHPKQETLMEASARRRLSDRPMHRSSTSMGGGDSPASPTSPIATAPPASSGSGMGGGGGTGAGKVASATAAAPPNKPSPQRAVTPRMNADASRSQFTDDAVSGPSLEASKILFSFATAGPPNSHVLFLGLDGSGKSTIAKALGKPFAYKTAELIHMPTEMELMAAAKEGGDAAMPYEVVPLDDKLVATTYQRRCVRANAVIVAASGSDKRPSSPGGNGGRSGPSVRLVMQEESITKLPAKPSALMPGVAAAEDGGAVLPKYASVDTSGAPSMRLLWPLFFARHRSHPLKLRALDAVVYCIDAQDPLRLHLAWSELVHLVNESDVKNEVRRRPLLVALTRTRMSDREDDLTAPPVGSIDTVGLLRAVEDFGVLQHPNWSILEVDLVRQAAPEKHKKFNVADLRTIVEWLLDVVP